MKSQVAVFLCFSSTKKVQLLLPKWLCKVLKVFERDGNGAVCRCSLAMFDRGSSNDGARTIYN